MALKCSKCGCNWHRDDKECPYCFAIRMCNEQMERLGIRTMFTETEDKAEE